jgi:hypothetical protein
VKQLGELFKTNEIMKLTGKAKEYFEKWLINFFREKRPDYRFNFTDESILRKHYRKTDVEQNALIIEWLNAIQYKGHNFYTYVFDFYYKYKIESQTIIDIQTQTIEKANEIYNEKL